MRSIFLGTMGWSYPFWVGKFYPPKTESRNFLEEYAQHFTTVEINNTFYRTPRITTVKTWKSQTPAEFQFAVKMPRKITHILPLQIDDYARHFFEVIAHLDEKLGPILIQFPPKFTEYLLKKGRALAGAQYTGIPLAPRWTNLANCPGGFS